MEAEGKQKESEAAEPRREKVSSGSEVFDRLLDGGYERGVVTTIYGPAGSGKTTACLMALAQVAREQKAVFIDTEGGFSVERLKLLAQDYEEILPRTLVHSPTDFSRQDRDIHNLQRLGNRAGIVICDTISSLYRAERGEDNAELNRELARQVALLVELARTRDIPVLITSQVYADFEDKTSIRLIGGDILTYSSKCLIELQIIHSNKREAFLRKHRYLPERSMVFEIQGKGFLPTSSEATKEKRFRIF